jgi:branched-chain amino acid aminotransferase
MSICYIDGAFRPTGEASLPLTDLAIQRGVGVFDSMKIMKKKVLAITAHMKRLEESAICAGMKIEGTGIIEDITRVLREGACRDDCPGDGDSAMAKAYITGGDAIERGFFTDPRYFVIFEEVSSMFSEGLNKGVALQPTSERRPYPAVKSINYLFGLMQAAGLDDVFECLYCPDGYATETLRSSFFICREGRIATAPGGTVLNGVTRNIVIELAKADGFTVEERLPKTSEFAAADEAFITNSLCGVLPVIRIGDTIMADGKPGPVSTRLIELYDANIERWLDK